MCLATTGELWGLTHHDPYVLIGTPAAIVIVGAAVGTGEGLRDRLRSFFVGVNADVTKIEDSEIGGAEEGQKSE
jgi:hypothetical protein